MKTRILLLVFLMGIPLMQLSAKKREKYRVSDYKAGHFILQNGKVYFEQIPGKAMRLQGIANKLGSQNAPQGGIQVKQTEKDMVRGVLIRKTFDWAGMGYKPKQLPWFAKMPLNGNFELSAPETGTRIRVTDMWFTNQMKTNNQQNLAIERIVLKKNGMAFRKNKKLMRGLEMLDQGLSQTFEIENVGF